MRDPSEPDPQLEQYLKAYSALQEQQGRQEEARQRLAALFPTVLERFQLAARAYRHAIAIDDAAARQESANAMRNCVWGLKGELLEKAKKQPKQNMTWEQMVERLMTDSVRAGLLLEQGATHSLLITILSDLSKGRPTSHTLGEAWTQFLDHVYIVSGCCI